jgi:hypothetical protein
VGIRNRGDFVEFRPEFRVRLESTACPRGHDNGSYLVGTTSDRVVRSRNGYMYLTEDQVEHSRYSINGPFTLECAECGARFEVRGHVQ